MAEEREVEEGIKELLGGLIFEELSELLFDDELSKLSEFPGSERGDEDLQELPDYWSQMVALAHERRRNGLRVNRRKKSLKENYHEMIVRQQAGEKIHYGDIEDYEERLVKIEEAKGE